MKYIKKSDDKLEPPFDLNYLEQYKWYKAKERHTPIKNLTEFWFGKLYGSKIEISLSLSEIFFIKKLLRNYISQPIFEPYDEQKRYIEDERTGVNNIISKLQRGLDDNLNSPDVVENHWKDNVNNPYVGVSDEQWNAYLEDDEGDE